MRQALRLLHPLDACIRSPLFTRHVSSTVVSRPSLEGDLDFPSCLLCLGSRNAAVPVPSLRLRVATQIMSDGVRISTLVQMRPTSLHNTEFLPTLLCTSRAAQMHCLSFMHVSLEYMHHRKLLPSLQRIAPCIVCLRILQLSPHCQSCLVRSCSSVCIRSLAFPSLLALQSQTLGC